MWDGPQGGWSETAPSHDWIELQSRSSVPASSHSTAPLALACLAAALGAGVVPGCGETIDVGGDGLPVNPLPGPPPSIADAGSWDAGYAGDAMPPATPGMVESTAQPLYECGSSGAGAGGIAGGPGISDPVSCAGTTSIECFGGGRGVRATLTPLDCVPGVGLIGDRARVQTLCSAALDGQSGESCRAPFSCGRVASDTCCIDFALCRTDAQLRRFRVCPNTCPGPRSTSGAVVASCDDMKLLWQLDSSAGAWLGTPCLGRFSCAASSVLTRADAFPAQEDLYYCANGAVQMVPLFIPAL